MKISNGKIRLENRIIDFSNFETYPKTTEEDLEKYYGSFIEHVSEIRDYFKDENAFDKAVNDSAYEKKPKLIARETKYPFMWAFRTSFMPFDFLKPSKRKLHDDYFMVAHCITKIPTKKIIEGKEKHLDERLREDIAEKFKQYQDYEGIIEIPNDRNPHETKAFLFHESLHYLISRYQAETDRNFVNVFIKEDLSQLEKYQAEQMIHELAVETLTDKLLIHDSDAQFEERWLSYSLNDSLTFTIRATSAITTGILLGISITRPYLLPIALLPGRIRDYTLNKYKKNKKQEILKLVEYPEFKL